MRYQVLLSTLVGVLLFGLLGTGGALIGPGVASFSRALAVPADGVAVTGDSRLAADAGYRQLSSARSLNALAPGAQALAGKKICLDAGHGGDDPGAIHAALNLHEADINLDEAYAIRALLQKAGATVVMVRTGDETLSNTERYIVCDRAQATILVSIHTNSLVDPAYNGTLTYYGKRSSAPDIALAEALHAAMWPVILKGAPDPANFINFGARRFGATVLRRSSMPAALVEPAFLSNPAEARLLATPIYTAPDASQINPACANLSCRRGQIALTVYQGILDYFGVDTNDAARLGGAPL